MLLSLDKYACGTPFAALTPAVRTGEVADVEESMVLVRLESGVGRDISGGEMAVISANVSMKMDWLKLILGGVLGCFKSGCA